PLVRIERDRIRELDPRERRASTLGERRKDTVRSVDVAADTALAAELAHLAQGIDRTGARRAGGRPNEERLPAPGRVGGPTPARRHARDEAVCMRASGG